MTEIQIESKLVPAVLVKRLDLLEPN